MTDPKPVVVVIEDDPPIRRFLRTGLSTHGFVVFEADNGRQGIIEAGSRKPDLIILDLGLPDMDGVEVIRAVREWSAMPIIVLSARSAEQNKIEALDAGADDYLTKPFGLGELLARIRVALRHWFRGAGAKPVRGFHDRQSTGRFAESLGTHWRYGGPSHAYPIPAVVRAGSTCRQGVDPSSNTEGSLGAFTYGKLPLS